MYPVKQHRMQEWLGVGDDAAVVIGTWGGTLSLASVSSLLNESRLPRDDSKALWPFHYLSILSET